MSDQETAASVQPSSVPISPETIKACAIGATLYHIGLLAEDWQKMVPMVEAILKIANNPDFAARELRRIPNK